MNMKGSPEIRTPSARTIRAGNTQGNLVLNPKCVSKLNRLLGVGGVLQQFIDASVLKGLSPYVPFRVGALEKSASLHTVVGSGYIIYKTPYARYLYYGILMVDPLTKSAWARRGVRKTTTQTYLQFDASRHPRATRLWGEVYKRNHMQELMSAVKKELRGRF